MEVPLTGSWERAGRSPASAAIFGLLIVGVVYFYGQTTFTLLGVLLAKASGVHVEQTGDFFADLEQITRATRVPVQISLVLSQFLLMLVPAWWLVRRWHSHNVRGYIRAHAAPAQEVLLAVTAAMLFLPLNVWISGSLVRDLGIPERLIAINEILFTPENLPELVWLIFVVALTPALCEEVLFRGFAQRTLERAIGWKSVLVVGTLFGLYHMQPLGLLSLSALGFLFGFLFYRSRSLVPAIAAHFTNNAFAVVLLFGGGSASMAATTGWETVTGALILEVPVIWLYMRLTKAQRLS